MKKLFLFSVCAFFALTANSQAAFNHNGKYNDTCLALQKKMPDNERLNNIQLNLLKFSETYSKGTACVLIGLCGTATGATLLYDGNHKAAPYISIGSGVLMLTGALIQIAAHHFLRKAGGYQ